MLSSSAAVASSSGESHTAMSPAPTSTAAVVDPTVTVPLPLTPSLVAVMVAVPAVHPKTSPSPVTFATAVLLLDHVTSRSARGLPAASFGVPVIWTSSPTSTLAGLGDTSTDATAGPGVLPWQSPVPTSVNVNPLIGMNCQA